MVKFMNTMTKVLFPLGFGQMLQRFSIFLFDYACIKCRHALTGTNKYIICIDFLCRF